MAVDDASISRNHAIITVRAGKVALRDLGSKNGTFRGDVRVTDAVPLADGDEIRVGTVRVKFRAARRESTVTAAGS